MFTYATWASCETFAISVTYVKNKSWFSLLIISSWFSLKTPYKLRNLWQVFKPEKKTENPPIRLKLESKEVHLYSKPFRGSPMQGIGLKRQNPTLGKDFISKSMNQESTHSKNLSSATLKRYFRINPKSFTTIKPISNGSKKRSDIVYYRIFHLLCWNP